MYSEDYQVKQYVMDLFAKEKLDKQQARQKILKFFSAYDASRDLNILLMKKHFATRKNENQKIKTSQASDFSEKTEIEQLFLECMESCKRDQYKTANAKPGLKPPKPTGEAREEGVHFAMNGTIS